MSEQPLKDKVAVVTGIPYLKQRGAGPVVTGLNQGGASGFEGEWLKAPDDVVSLALFLATQPEIGPTAQSFSLMRRDN